MQDENNLLGSEARNSSSCECDNCTRKCNLENIENMVWDAEIRMREVA